MNQCWLAWIACLGCASQSRAEPTARPPRQDTDTPLATSTLVLPGTPASPSLPQTTPLARGKGTGTARRLVFTHADDHHHDWSSFSGARVLVSTSLAIEVPSTVAYGGHGPFATVYDATKDVRVTTERALAPVAKERTVVVTCTRPGVFSVRAEAVALDGTPLVDSYDVECIAPTRLRATTDPGTIYLARASTVSVNVAYYGHRAKDGAEVELLGSLPVVLAPDRAPSVTLGTGGFSGNVRLRPTRAFSGEVILASAGLTTAVPLTAIDAGWNLRLRFSKGPRKWLQVIADTNDGTPISIDGCSITATRAGVESSRTSCSQPRLVHPSQVERLAGGLRPADWQADRVCVTVLDRKVCEDVPL